ncbi:MULTISPECIES: hypothetical protein [Streptomyces]|uniref:hypothetical protein n=1 Tax=Streptomyces TaxID=1883 RepID=UPI00136F24BD|nr:hypothetical protein [Streptomyces sp. XHT-2]MYQ29806.1 hypothetical protein [Streptomyces sp. SID4956]
MGHATETQAAILWELVLTEHAAAGVRRLLATGPTFEHAHMDAIRTWGQHLMMVDTDSSAHGRRE